MFKLGKIGKNRVHNRANRVLKIKKGRKMSAGVKRLVRDD
jgi:hypothetical protein